MKIGLQLGSGASPRTVPDSYVIHLDQVEGPHVELVCNLNHGIPLPSNTVDFVLAANVIEHLDDVVKIMNEMHRVLVPGGVAWIQVPLFGTANHITDPTHKHGFAWQSFDFFDDETELGKFNGKLYTPRRWRIKKREEVTQDLLIQLETIKPNETAKRTAVLFQEAT